MEIGIRRVSMGRCLDEWTGDLVLSCANRGQLPSLSDTLSV
jgi:hypothetical protein